MDIDWLLHSLPFFISIVISADRHSGRTRVSQRCVLHGVICNGDCVPRNPWPFVVICVNLLCSGHFKENSVQLSPYPLRVFRSSDVVKYLYKILHGSILRERNLALSGGSRGTFTKWFIQHRRTHTNHNTLVSTLFGSPSTPYVCERSVHVAVSYYYLQGLNDRVLVFFNANPTEGFHGVKANAIVVYFQVHQFLQLMKHERDADSTSSGEGSNTDSGRGPSEEGDREHNHSKDRDHSHTRDQAPHGAHGHPQGHGTCKLYLGL